MNNKGFAITTTILIIAAITGGSLWAANASGLLGMARSGEACGLPIPRPCIEGTICNNGVCTPTISGGIDRFLYSVSLSNIFCRGNILATASCNIVINLGGAVILGILAMLLAVLILGNVPNTAVLGVAFIVGAVLGLALAQVINYFWWLMVIVIVIMALIAFKLEMFK